MEFTVSHSNVLALNLPSIAIIVVDSRVCDANYGTVLSNTYNKLNEILPNVFLACFGDCSVIHQVLESLAADLPNIDRSMGEIALFVQNTVNTIRQNNPPEENEEEDEDDFTLPRFVLLGRGCGDNRHYFFKITKGESTNMYFAKREVGHVVFGGSEAVNSFLEENNLDFESVSEDDAVKYAFECLKDAVENDWVAGGKIQVVAMKPGGGSSVLHSWEQSDPSICDSEYIYQGPRFIRGLFRNSGDQNQDDQEQENQENNGDSDSRNVGDGDSEKVTQDAEGEISST